MKSTKEGVTNWQGGQPAKARRRGDWPDLGAAIFLGTGFSCFGFLRGSQKTVPMKCVVVSVDRKRSQRGWVGVKKLNSPCLTSFTKCLSNCKLETVDGARQLGLPWTYLNENFQHKRENRSNNQSTRQYNSMYSKMVQIKHSTPWSNQICLLNLS